MKTDHLHIRASDWLKPGLDSLRRVETDLPSQSEMVHRLVSRALAAGDALIGEAVTGAQAQNGGPK